MHTQLMKMLEKRQATFDTPQTPADALSVPDVPSPASGPASVEDGENRPASIEGGFSQHTAGQLPEPVVDTEVTPPLTWTRGTTSHKTRHICFLMTDGDWGNGSTDRRSGKFWSDTRTLAHPRCGHAYSQGVGHHNSE